MIKHKNGEEYQLRKPNPLMKEQDIWEEYILHNFNWNEEKRKEIKNKKREKTNEKAETKKETTKINLEKSVKEKSIEKDKNKDKDPKDSTNPKEDNEYFDALCLIAENIAEKDEIYNEVKRRTKYTKKEIIKIKIIENNDLFLYFYTPENIEINSIVFPKNKEKRWWKIKKAKDKIYECIPSDVTPSFD